jgi:voltage-gated potassium channel
MTGVTTDDDVPPGTNRRVEAVGRGGVLAQALRAPDSYALLLLLLIIDYVILSVGWSGSWALIVTTGFLSLTAVLTFHTSRVRGAPFTLVVACSALAMIAAIAAAINGQDEVRGIPFILMSLLVVGCPVAILSRIVHHTRVTAETLLGAICVYILIGLFFAYVDLAYQFIAKTSYFAQPGHHGPSDFVYFSFITLTTVGYGDLSPAHGLPRTTSVLEALMGQIFLVVLVARLVAMYTPGSAASRRARLRTRLEGSASEIDDDQSDRFEPGVDEDR